MISQLTPLVIVAHVHFVTEREFITEIVSVATNLNGIDDLDVAECLSMGKHIWRYHWKKSYPYLDTVGAHQLGITFC
jgi:hypothetical protein